MASSYEIAQMFSQQNSMFMGQNQFAQSMGVPAPPSIMNQVGVGGGGGVGAMGMGRPGGGGFSWGQSGMMGYGPGNSMAAGMMSGAGAAFTGGSMALGAASSFGMLGKMGAAFDPIGAGMGVARMAGGGIMGGMAGIGAASGIVGLGMLASQGVQSFVGGGQQQSQMNTMLGQQYQHFNPMSRTGAGFTRDDAKSIGDMTRQLSHLPEMMTEYGELQKIMGKLKSSGTMQGVRSAADFQARFKEAITTIRETAKILGTTMEEAEQFFSASRGAGFYGRSAQLKNVMSAQFTSGVTGASIGQVAGLQQAGADMAMASGARRGLGATAVTNMAQSIGLAQASGKLREGAVEDVTGLQGPEAQMALAQKMYGGMMNFGKTAAGRLAMAGMMKFEGDRAVGVDEEKVKAFQRGELSVDDLKRTAGGLTNKQKISFTTRQADLVSSLAGQMGAGGASAMMRQVLGKKGDDETTNLIMQRLTGMSAGEADIAQGMEGVSGDSEQGQMARFRMSQASRKERTDPSAVMKKIKTRLHAATFGKLEQMGADVQNSIAKSIDQFFDDVVGREVSTLTEERAKAISSAFGGSQSKEAQDMLKGLMKMDTKGLSGGGGVPKRGINSMGIGGRVGLGIATMGLSEAVGGAIEGIRGLGGEDSTMSRMFASMSGQMTRGQEAEFGASIFGTATAAGQLSGAERFKKGGLAGRGAAGALSEILGEGGMEGMSGAQRLQHITKGLEQKVQDAISGTGISLHSLETARNPDVIIDGLKISDDKKKLLKSYMAAHDDRSRAKGASVYAQMAAASGMGDDFAALAGLGGSQERGKAATAAVLKAQDALTKAVGETASGYLQQGGKRAQKLFSAATGADDEALQLAIQNSDTPEGRSKVKALMAAKGIDISDKEIGSLKEAIGGYSQVKGRNATGTAAALKQWESAANQKAGSEALLMIKDLGSKLVGSASDAGAASEAQKALGMAMSDIGEKGLENPNEPGISEQEKKRREEANKATMGGYQDKFRKYQEAISGIKDKGEREKAIAAGGAVGQLAATASSRVEQGLKRGGKFGSKEEAAKFFGVSVEDVDQAGGMEGGKLKEETMRKLASMSGAGGAASAAMSGAKAPEKSESQRMIDVLQGMDANNKAIASVLAGITKDPELKKALETVAASGKETANAGKGGNVAHAGDTK